MNTRSAPLEVAILAFPETTASVTFGIYDLLMAAGRDWGFVVTGQPGPSLMQPTIVSARHGTFVAANDVPITPQATLEDRADASIICIPELAVPPSDPLSGRFNAEIEWLKRCYARGATIATACSGVSLPSPI